MNLLLWVNLQKSALRRGPAKSCPFGGVKIVYSAS